MNHRAIVVGLHIERIRLQGKIQLRQGLVVAAESTQSTRQARAQAGLLWCLGQETLIHLHRLVVATFLEGDGCQIAVALY